MTNVVITGSSKGVGRGLAEQFVRRGHNVTVSARGQASIDSSVAELRALGEGSVTGCACDVSRKDQVQALWDHAVSEFGSVDLWINNAGTATAQYPAHEVPENVVHTLVDSNVKGTIFGSQIAVKGFRSAMSDAEEAKGELSDDSNQEDADFENTPVEENRKDA